ncbi:GHMP kinase [Crocinitomicaceae bacterium CZZ-1]|uniref:GHMP kinase n=1 Tax=Taishania pollutisoli TaxID=2766479 RepID=A0A8J6P421_9FLAO|nr:GYDIA family GHMP kinase [Taishania pollutisoli]MBC9811057.1 GHMP kinase [Taishania pollutisoli]MBX2950213.1 GHMP kinase [Crocinitomicaceae bacterium]
MAVQENTIKTYQASGKLMLFGEYLVLNGSDCVAFPLKFGQTLSVTKSGDIRWESYSKHGMWFSASMSNDFTLLETNNEEVAEILQRLFRVIRTERPELDFQQYFKAEANFELNWGLGSSSTLISLLNQWSGVDPRKLLDVSFGGSGYDVACATATAPIVYANGNVKMHIDFPASVTNNLLFIYLGNKQNSREEIKRFKKATITQEQVDAMNTMISTAIQTDAIEVFEQQLDRSEALISSIIGTDQLKQRLFSDYPYSVKSLGAWGGDFFLATCREQETAKDYFEKKGYTTLFTYHELIK